MANLTVVVADDERPARRFLTGLLQQCDDVQLVGEAANGSEAVSEAAIREATARLARESGIDAAPEGGCALAVLESLVRAGRIARDAEVVVFNTGSGVSYRV